MIECFDQVTVSGKALVALAPVPISVTKAEREYVPGAAAGGISKRRRKRRLLPGLMAGTMCSATSGKSATPLPLAERDSVRSPPAEAMLPSLVTVTRAEPRWPAAPLGSNFQSEVLEKQRVPSRLARLEMIGMPMGAFSFGVTVRTSTVPAAVPSVR